MIADLAADYHWSSEWQYFSIGCQAQIAWLSRRWSWAWVGTDQEAEAMIAQLSKWSSPVSRLRSSYTPLDQHLISFAISIYWTMRSSPQPHDLCLLSPAFNVYSAMRYVPESRLRSTVSRLTSSYTPLDQHLISFAISIYWAMRCSPQPHDLCLLNPAITAYSAVRYVPDIRLRSTVTRLISDNQPLDQHLLTTLSAPFSRLIIACQLLDQRLSAAKILVLNKWHLQHNLLFQEIQLGNQKHLGNGMQFHQGFNPTGDSIC